MFMLNLFLNLILGGALFMELIGIIAVMILCYIFWDSFKSILKEIKDFFRD